MQRMGFKEWAVVCEALGRGEQSIIVRKGGIAEGGDGFSFAHREFFLFPTWFHEQAEKVRTTLAMPEQSESEILIKYFAIKEDLRVVRSWNKAAALAPLHILRSDVVRQRFDYENAPGMHVAFVRVFRAAPAWTLPNEKRFGGCRSWVDLPEPTEAICLEPVLSEAEHEERRATFLSLVDSEPAALPDNATG